MSTTTTPQVFVTKVKLACIGATPEAIAIMVGPFAVLESGDGWSITHAKSGYYVKANCCCVFSAIRMAEALIPVTDWSRVAEQLRTLHEVERAAVAQTLADVSCPDDDCASLMRRRSE